MNSTVNFLVLVIDKEKFFPNCAKSSTSFGRLHEDMFKNHLSLIELTEKNDWLEKFIKSR